MSEKFEFIKSDKVQELEERKKLEKMYKKFKYSKGRKLTEVKRIDTND